MEKSISLTQSFLCEKAGYASRPFTLQQLEAMGTDPGGNSYDGWKIIDEPVRPSEVSKAKATKLKSNSHAITGKTESTGGSDNISSERAGGESSAHGSEGDGKAD